MVDDPEHTLPIAENQAVKGRDVSRLHQVHNHHVGIGLLRALGRGGKDFGEDLGGIHSDEDKTRTEWRGKRKVSRLHPGSRK